MSSSGPNLASAEANPTEPNLPKPTHSYPNHTLLSPYPKVLACVESVCLALEVVEAVRAVWPDDLPLFFRTSAVDGDAEGWQLDDTVKLAGELKARGVDVVDCSSGGISGPATAGGRRQPGFQVPYAEEVRKKNDLATMAVGLITHPKQAEAILESGQADLIALGREALANPNWPLHAAETLGHDVQFDTWPDQYGWWLVRRAATSDFYAPDDDT